MRAKPPENGTDAFLGMPPLPSWHPGLTEQLERGLLLLLLTPHSSLFSSGEVLRVIFAFLGANAQKWGGHGNAVAAVAAFLYTIGCRFNDPVGVSFPDLLLPSDTPVFQGTTPSFFPQKRCLAFGRADKCILSLFFFGLFWIAVWGFGLCTHLNCFPKKSISLSAVEHTTDEPGMLHKSISGGKRDLT